MAYQRSFTVEEVLQELGFNNNTPKRQNCNIIDEVNEDALGDDKDNFDNQFVKGLMLQYECNEDEQNDTQLPQLTREDGNLLMEPEVTPSQDDFPKRQNCNIVDEVNEDALGDDKDNFDNQFVKGLMLQYECNEDEQNDTQLPQLTREDGNLLMGPEVTPSQDDLHLLPIQSSFYDFNVEKAISNNLDIEHKNISTYIEEIYINNFYHQQIVRDEEGEKYRYIEAIDQDEDEDVMCVMKSMLLSVATNLRPKKQFRSKEDVAMKNLQKYAILPRCTDHSVCNEVTQKQRYDINLLFWYKSFDERRQWLDSYITISPLKNKKVNRIKDNRNVTLTYYLPIDNGGKLQICKTLFLSTSGMKTDSAITEFVRCKRNSSGGLSPTSVGKGKHKRKLKYIDNVKEHINSFHPYVSHYKLRDAPNRRYFDSECSISVLHKDFTSKVENICYETYRKIFKQENIGFSSPKADECEDCLLHKIHLSTSGHDPDAYCDDCTIFFDHQRRYREAREEYEKGVV